MAGGGTAVAVLLVRAALLACAYAMVPWLVGEARYVSLEAPAGAPAPSLTLPSVAHARRPSAPLVSRWTKTTLPTSSLLFCVALEETLILFVLVFFEHVHADLAWLRWHWWLSLSAVQAWIIVVLPLYACMLLCFGHARRQWRTTRGVASVGLYAAWVWALVRVPLPSTVAPSTTGFMGRLLVRTALLGVALIGVLSGGVAAGAMCDAYEMRVRRRRWSAQDLASTRASFQRTLTDLQERRSTAADLQAEIDAGDAPRPTWQFWRRGAKERELASLQMEIAGLSAVASALRSDVELQEAQDARLRRARTPLGYVMLLGGYLFAAYCALRLVQSVLNLLVLGYRTASSRDWTSILLAQAMHLLGIPVDVATWSPRISVLLVGGLIGVRMHVILGALSTLVQSVSTGVSTQLLVLFTSQVLCIYGEAALIQMHAAAGAAAAHGSALLATLPEFQRVFGRTFDLVFLLAACATAAYRWFQWHSDSTMAGAPSAL